MKRLMKGKRLCGCRMPKKPGDKYQAADKNCRYCNGTGER